MSVTEIAGEESSGAADRPQAAAFGRRGAAEGFCAGDFARHQEAPAEKMIPLLIGRLVRRGRT